MDSKKSYFRYKLFIFCMMCAREIQYPPSQRLLQARALCSGQDGDAFSTLSPKSLPRDTVMMRATLSLLLLSAQHALAQTDSHAGHDHSGATKHEWAGLFKVETASQTWKMQKVGGKVR